MIRHILLLQPRADTTPKAINDCRKALTALPGRIPGLLNCYWGQNLAPADRREGLIYGFTMDFRDAQSLEAYFPHPEHKPVATLVGATFERIVVFDLAL
jgi:hypothetical protein